MPDIRVLVADDQAAVRDGLVTIIEHAPGIAVAGVAEDGVQAVRLAEELDPDVVLMDLRMPGMDGVAATAAISGPAVLVLTTYSDDASIVAALQAGAAGYLTKSAGREQIVAAITATAAGHSTFGPEVARTVVKGLSARTRLEELTQRYQLTDQEAKVLALMARGKSNRAIADSLYISVATVKTHANNLFGKLHVANRAEAAALLT
ncbi:response regulator transcription factor [Actinophytocola oryzae]|uniref:DNA-binding NarL/FixJ family response regulator n=1 Tax=Actinophytocola oryzae TaxID=502181 RepID=A0A4R7V2N6_9PSEU|nr:response regulator transcription factor [Actinophytocola oryzae]TDV43110.1 DNA-binding NarL/FixJ family response regulator [Actinophytocola oryzae]